MAPLSFHRIELRRVGGKPFEMDVIPQRKQLPSGAAMRGQAIQDNHERPTELVPQLQQKAADVFRANVFGVHLKERVQASPLWRNGNRGDYRQAIPAIPGALHGCFAARSPGATIHRLQAEPGFVEKHQGLLQPPRFFLIAGQR